MMERVSSGENLIGFNILGSYAEARAKNDPSLGIAYPKDYTLVLSRVSFISQQAQNSNAAKLWLDYVLSEKGQSILASQADIPSIRNDIDGKNDIDGLTKVLGNALKPIPVDESLLEYLQPKNAWSTSNSGVPPPPNKRLSATRVVALLLSEFVLLGCNTSGYPMNTLRRKWQSLPRGIVVLITATVIYTPLSFIVIQSFLSAPFFSPAKEWSLESFGFIFTDPDFYKALKSGFILAFGLVIIAIPLGGVLAFLMVRTDLPGRRLIEPLILVPVFVSPMVLGFGYVVAAGPVGFLSLWAQALIGFVPWNIYDMSSIVVIAGLTHVPHAYLYISSALRSVGSDVEEAARTAGASPLQVMTSVSLPMVRPSILYAIVLLFFLGLEVFGLMLVLGDPEGNMVLATYLYQLTNKLGTPSYHLMAAVAVVLICITIPLVMLQRRLMRTANRFVTMKGKASQARALPLGKWRWVAGAVVAFWLTVTIGVPLLGVVLRAFISNWGVGVSLWNELSLSTFRTIWAQPNLLRAIVNSMSIGVIGGALAVACYLFVGIAMHRKPDNTTRFWITASWCRAPCWPARGSGLSLGVPVPANVAG